MKFTVEQFASANGVEKPVAYGTLRYLEEKGLATSGKADKPKGQKGKPATVYDVSESVVSALSISEYVAPVATETVTETAQPSAETQPSEQPAA